MNRFVFPGLLLAVSLVFLIPGIGGKDFPGQGDEVMHLVTVQQSLEAKSYFVPVIDGTPNYYKPPLLFWAGMLTEKLFGPGLFGARFSSVLFSAGTVLFMYYLMVVWGSRPWTAFIAALAYLFSIGTMKFGRLLMMEQGMAFFFMAFVFLFMEYYRTGRYLPLILSALFSGAAFLFKGPIFLVYTGLFLLIWASMRLFRFRTDPVRFRYPSGFWKVARAGIVYSVVALIVPAVWVAALFSYGDYVGKALLAYFFIVENAGKFAQADQSEVRILFGWVVYTFPWTVVVLVGMYFSVRSRFAYGKLQIAGRLLLMTVIVTTIFHFIPNRKAAYYGIPFMPLLFAGIPMMLRDLVVLERWSRLSILLVYLVMPVLGAAAYLGSGSALGFLLLIPAIAGVILEQMAKRSPDFPSGAFRDLRSLKILGVVGVLVILVMQFVLYPLLNREVIPVHMADKFARKICVISSESWDAMDLKAIVPNVDVRVVPPGSPVTCIESERAVLYVPDSSKMEALYSETLGKAGYRLADSWVIWKRQLNFYDIMDYWKSGPPITTRALYYEKH